MLLSVLVIERAPLEGIRKYLARSSASIVLNPPRMIGVGWKMLKDARQRLPTITMSWRNQRMGLMIIITVAQNAIKAEQAGIKAVMLLFLRRRKLLNEICG